MKIFEKQLEHLVSLLALLAVVWWISRGESFRAGAYLGLSTPAWLTLAIAIPVAHQIFVWLSWRLELYYGYLTRLFGERGFTYYAIVFVVLFIGRLLGIIGLAIANQGNLEIAQRLLYGLAVLAAIPAIWVMVSVARYFGVTRAFGIDHFEASYREKPLVRKGSFKYIPNSMYTLGLLVLWIPGLIWASPAALLAAGFNHTYIWAHYYFVERPDMQYIYGAQAGQG